MQSVGLPTFQQTFAKCPFPEGVLAVLGTYPVEVRVVKAERAMLVRAIGAQVAPDILEQAQAVLVQAFRLNSAKIEVETPVAAVPEPVADAVPETAPATPEAPKAEAPEDIFAQMEAVRRQVRRAQATEIGQKKSEVEQSDGKINNR